jgi:hypothetical protein
MQPESRLVDEFRAEIRARGVEIPGKLEVIASFADFEWDEGLTADEAIARSERDPAFSVTGYSRWVVFARMEGEIRYYAASIPAGAPAWYWSGEDPARVAAVDAESDYVELAILPSVADAATLAIKYLSGRPLQEIGFPRIPPPWKN